jgi:hypothetical protein
MGLVVVTEKLISLVLNNSASIRVTAAVTLFAPLYKRKKRRGTGTAREIFRPLADGDRLIGALSASPPEITQLLVRWSNGDKSALEQANAAHL